MVFLFSEVFLMLYSYTIKDNKLFNRCFRKGRYCACKMLTAYYIPNDLPSNRIGISISKKVGNAVQRNRAKRIIRAAYRLRESDFPVGLDIVFAVRPGIDGCREQDVGRYFEKRLLPDMISAFDKNGEFVKKRQNTT